MDAGVPAPLPELLTEKVEEDAKRAPQEDERHIQHDGRNKSVGDGPWGDELAETVAPDVLVDSDSNEDGASDRLVAVNCVGGGDGRDGGNLDSSASVAHNNDGLQEMC